MRAGDCLALLVEHFYDAGNTKEALHYLKEMKIRKIALNPYIDADILDDIFKGSGDTSARDDPGAETAGAGAAGAGAGMGDEAKASDKPIQSKGPRNESKASTTLGNNYNNNGGNNNNKGGSNDGNSDDDDGEGIGEELDEEIADDEEDDDDNGPTTATNTTAQSRAPASQPKPTNTYNNNNTTNNRSDAKPVAPQQVKVAPNNRFRDDDSEGSGGIGEELDEVI